MNSVYPNKSLCTSNLCLFIDSFLGKEAPHISQGWETFSWIDTLCLFKSFFLVKDCAHISHWNLTPTCADSMCLFSIPPLLVTNSHWSQEKFVSDSGQSCSVKGSFFLRFFPEVNLVFLGGMRAGLCNSGSAEWRRGSSSSPSSALQPTVKPAREPLKIYLATSGWFNHDGRFKYSFFYFKIKKNFFVHSRQVFMIR